MIRYVLGWVERNIHAGSDISHLVQDVRCSRKKLEVDFFNQCGVSPGEYLARRRMSRAAMLLRLTALSITEISASLHFHNAQNFARSFKKFTGMTPTEYRQQEEWLTRALQKPLLMEGAHYTTVGISERPELRFHGQTSLHSHDFRSPSDTDGVIQTIKAAVSARAENNGDNKEIYIGCRLVPSAVPAEGRQLLAYVEITAQCDQDGQEDIIIPAGKYMQFSFSGSWQEYVVFTRLIYFQLSEENINRRAGPDLTVFTFPDNTTEEVTCRHLIPVG